MSKLINQVLLLKQSENEFTPKEVSKLKQSLNKICKERLKKAANTFVEAIDAINQ